MQNEPINTGPIQQFLKQVKGADAGRAKDVKTKNKMIDIYNTIYGTSYNSNTNCGSCLSTCFDGIKKLYNKYNKQ